jgi:multidrug efflux pump subunit AcrA (membrane-fusion protein)
MKSARASLDRAKINLEYATIYAPISGVVINRAVNVGQTVAASFSSPTLYTIANDLSKMQVLTTVDESDIGRISIGQQATFTVDAYPDQNFRGLVSQIRLAPVSIQNVVNYTVVIDVNNAQLKLMPGMTANVKVLVADMHDVLKVPNLALRFQPPADVIDTSNASARRGAFAAKSSADTDSSARAANVSADPPHDGAQGDKTSGDRRQRSQALRDSITAAHGGNISEEELRTEMRNAFNRTGNTESQAASQVIQHAANKKKVAQFGMDVRFPEYEKSAYTPQHESGRGRVWVVNSKGKLEQVFVKTGVTDGKYTEVTAVGLKPGDQVVLGVNYAAGAAADQARSPLTGGGQQRPGGGFR